jgi:TPR repeat protein
MAKKNTRKPGRKNAGQKPAGGQSRRAEKRQARRAAVQSAPPVKTAAAGPAPAETPPERPPWMVSGEADLRQKLAAAGKGDRRAQVAAASALYLGLAGPKDHAEALRWCLAAGEGGERWGWRRAAAMMILGEGGKPDPGQIRRLLARLGAAGDPWAQCLVGLSCLHGLYEPPDPQKAFKWLRWGASQGCPDAMAQLAALFGGTGDAADLARSLELLRRLAPRRHPEALLLAGQYGLAGHGLPVDAQRGLVMCERAAQAGSVQALYFLGWIRSFGPGVIREQVRGAGLLRAARDCGHPGAAGALKELYAMRPELAADDPRTKRGQPKPGGANRETFAAVPGAGRRALPVKQLGPPPGGRPLDRLKAALAESFRLYGRRRKDPGRALLGRAMVALILSRLPGWGLWDGAEPDDGEPSDRVSRIVQKVLYKLFQSAFEVGGDRARPSRFRRFNAHRKGPARPAAGLAPAGLPGSSGGPAEPSPPAEGLTPAQAEGLAPGPVPAEGLEAGSAPAEGSAPETGAGSQVFLQVFERMAMKGSVRGQLSLGMIRTEGWAPGASDPEAGERWLERAASRGSRVARRYLRRIRPDSPAAARRASRTPPPWANSQND